MKEGLPLLAPLNVQEKRVISRRWGLEWWGTHDSKASCKRIKHLTFNCWKKRKIFKTKIAKIIIIQI